MSLLDRPRDWRALRPWRRHSLVVSVGGVVYVALGCVFALIPSPERARQLTFPYEPLEHLGLPAAQLLGVAWMLVGGLAFLSARWPTWSETWGYVALAVWGGVWSTFYVASVLFWDAPARGISGCIIFAFFAFLFWAISGLRNPDDVTLETLIARGDLE